MKCSAVCRSTTFPAWAARPARLRGNPILAALLRLGVSRVRARARETLRRRPGHARGTGPARQSQGPSAAATVPDCLRHRRAGRSGLGAWTLFPRHVEVSFVTEPFEATIYLDDAVLLDPQGVPYTTPCTVGNLPVVPVTSNSSVRAGRVGMPASTTWPRRSRS